MDVSSFSTGGLSSRCKRNRLGLLLETRTRCSSWRGPEWPCRLTLAVRWPSRWLWQLKSIPWRASSLQTELLSCRRRQCWFSHREGRDSRKTFRTGCAKPMQGTARRVSPSIRWLLRTSNSRSSPKLCFAFLAARYQWPWNGNERKVSTKIYHLSTYSCRLLIINRDFSSNCSTKSLNSPNLWGGTISSAFFPVSPGKSQNEYWKHQNS